MLRFANAVRRRAHDVRARLRPDVETPGRRRLTAGIVFGSGRLAGGPGPVVSLTTYAPRAPWVHLAIQSIGRGSLTPSRTILWLDDEAILTHLPRPLRRLRRRGLEIRLVENFGPHTKYFPYIESEDRFPGPLVTADDDTVYPRSWLARLAAEHEATPDVIVCYRARIGAPVGGTLPPYAEWPLSDLSMPSFLNFLTAVSGTIHPVPVLDALKARGREFMSVSPQNDDLWIHHTALREGIRVRVIDGVSATFPLIDETQADALWYVNLEQGRNDQQIGRTYDADDIAVLAAEAKRQHG